jgi:hypothetical protein
MLQTYILTLNQILESCLIDKVATQWLKGLTVSHTKLKRKQVMVHKRDLQK